MWQTLVPPCPLDTLRFGSSGGLAWPLVCGDPTDTRPRPTPITRCFRGKSDIGEDIPFRLVPLSAAVCVEKARKLPPWETGYEANANESLEYYEQHHAGEAIPQDLLENLFKEQGEQGRRTWGVIGNGVDGMELSREEGACTHVVAHATGSTGSSLAATVVRTEVEPGKAPRHIVTNRVQTDGDGLPIQQITFERAPTSLGIHAKPLVAARSLYGVSLMQLREPKGGAGAIAARCKGRMKLKPQPVHVVWNPHFRGELAVCSELGEVLLADLKAGGGPVQICPARSSDDADERAGNFFGLVYAAHPRCLVQASAGALWMVDERAPGPPSKLYKVLEEVGVTSILGAAGRFRYVPGTSHTAEHATTEHLARSAYGMHTKNQICALGEPLGWHFPVVDLQRLILFDLRRTEAPVFQWDHMMEYNPPHIVQLHPHDLNLGPDKLRNRSGYALMANTDGLIHTCHYELAFKTDPPNKGWEMMAKPRGPEDEHSVFNAYRVSVDAASSALHCIYGTVRSLAVMNSSPAPRGCKPKDPITPDLSPTPPSEDALRGIYLAPPVPGTKVTLLTQLSEDASVHVRAYRRQLVCTPPPATSEPTPAGAPDQASCSAPEPEDQGSMVASLAKEKFNLSGREARGMLTNYELPRVQGFVASGGMWLVGTRAMCSLSNVSGVEAVTPATADTWLGPWLRRHVSELAYPSTLSELLVDALRAYSDVHRDEIRGSDTQRARLDSEEVDLGKPCFYSFTAAGKLTAKLRRSMQGSARRGGGVLDGAAIGLPLDVLEAIRKKRGRVEREGTRRCYRQPTRGWAPKPSSGNGVQPNAEEEAGKASAAARTVREQGAAPTHRPVTRQHAQQNRQASPVHPQLRPEASRNSPPVACVGNDFLRTRASERNRRASAACPTAASVLRELRRAFDANAGERGVVQLATAFRNRNRRIAAQGKQDLQSHLCPPAANVDPHPAAVCWEWQLCARLNVHSESAGEVWSKIIHSAANTSQSSTRFNATEYQGNEGGGRYTCMGELVQLPFIEALNRLPSGGCLDQYSQTNIVVSSLENTSGEDNTCTVVDAHELELFEGVFKNWDSWLARSWTPRTTTQPFVCAKENGEGRDAGVDTNFLEYTSGTLSAIPIEGTESGAPNVSQADSYGPLDSGSVQTVGGVKEEDAARGPKISALEKKKITKRRLPRRDGF